MGFYVPIAIPLTDLIVRFQVREKGSGKLKFQKLSTVPGEITVTLETQHIWIQFLNADTKLLKESYNYEVECYNESLTYVQTLRKGTLTFNEEYSHG